MSDTTTQTPTPTPIDWTKADWRDRSVKKCLIAETAALLAPIFEVGSNPYYLVAIDTRACFERLMTTIDVEVEGRARARGVAYYGVLKTTKVHMTVRSGADRGDREDVSTSWTLPTAELCPQRLAASIQRRLPERDSLSASILERVRRHAILEARRRECLLEAYKAIGLEPEPGKRPSSSHLPSWLGIDPRIFDAAAPDRDRVEVKLTDLPIEAYRAVLAAIAPFVPDMPKDGE